MPGPAPRLVDVRLGEGAAKCAAKPGDAFCFTNVAHQPRVVLTFDRIMAPSSVARGNYSLVSGSSGDLNFKQIRVDPVERTVVFTIREDQKLVANTEYLLRIKSVDDPANRLAAFDGARFPGEVLVRFTTAAAPGVAEGEIDPAPADLPTAEARACAALSTLAGSCTGSLCHGDLKGAAPAMGLSLINYAAIRASAIGRSSVLVQAADDPGGVGRTTSDFPTGLPLIPSPSAGDGSARSFLLYKILMDPRVRPDAAAADAAAWARTASELRHRIPGAPMPHDTTVPEPGATVFAPIPLSAVRTIRRWIDDGAGECKSTSPPGDAGVDATSDAAPDAVGDSRTDALEGG